MPGALAASLGPDLALGPGSCKVYVFVYISVCMSVFLGTWSILMLRRVKKPGLGGLGRGGINQKFGLLCFDIEMGSSCGPHSQ